MQVDAGEVHVPVVAIELGAGLCSAGVIFGRVVAGVAQSTTPEIEAEFICKPAASKQVHSPEHGQQCLHEGT